MFPYSVCSINFNCIFNNPYKNNVDMKANEAPEKIILSADRDTQIIYDEWVMNDYTDNIKIEYIRTDVLIEKVLKWFKDYTGFTDLEGVHQFDEDGFEEFKKAIKL